MRYIIVSCYPIHRIGMGCRFHIYRYSGSGYHSSAGTLRQDSRLPFGGIRHHSEVHTCEIVQRIGSGVQEQRSSTGLVWWIVRRPSPYGSSELSRYRAEAKKIPTSSAISSPTRVRDYRSPKNSRKLSLTRHSPSVPRDPHQAV